MASDLIALMWVAYIAVGCVVAGAIWRVTPDELKPVSLFGGAMWPVTVVLFVAFMFVRLGYWLSDKAALAEWFK